MIIDPPVSPNLSLRGAGGDAAISGMGDGFETVSQPSFNPLAPILITKLLYLKLIL